jgi:hypothetical protein
MMDTRQRDAVFHGVRRDGTRPPHPGRDALRRQKPPFQINRDNLKYSVLLKKQTHRQVTAILRDQEDGPDVSELLQQLLEQWLEQQQK